MNSRQEPKGVAEYYSVWMCPHCLTTTERQPDDDALSENECEKCGKLAEPWIMTGDIQEAQKKRGSQ